MGVLFYITFGVIIGFYVAMAVVNYDSKKKKRKDRDGDL